MKVLIAEDDAISRRMLETTLTRWSYDVTTVSDGGEAWRHLGKPDAPHLVVLDWMMPELDGPEVCRRVRELENGSAFYMLLLTAKTQKEDIVAGLQAGADDYITKPYHPEELRARIQTGRRIVELQDRLADRIDELERALTEVKQLTGLLPICAYCKRIRDGDKYWEAVEAYIADHTQARFSHAVCPECYEKVVRPQLEEL